MNKKQQQFALIGMGLLNFLGCLDLTIVNTALPAIQQSFGINDARLQWVINMLLLALTASMVLVGKLGDRYGRRGVLYMGMILFALSSLGAAYSPHFDTLLGFRFIQGIAIAILYTAPIALMPSVFPNHVAKAMGIMVGVSGLGLALGPVFGGILTRLFSWHSIFLINLPLTLLAYLFCRNNIPEAKSIKQEKMDFLGALLLLILIPVLIFTTVNIHTLTWLEIFGMYGLVLILALIFIGHENKSSFPIIDFHLFAHRYFLVGLAANFFMAFFYTNAFFFIPLHLQLLGIHSSLKIGLILLPATAMVALVSPLATRACEHWSTQKVMLLGYGFFILSALLQIMLMHSDTIPVLLIAYLAIGIGWGCTLSPSLTAAVSSLPEEMGGVAIGSIGTLHNLGGTIGLAIGVTLGYFHAMFLVLASSCLAWLIIKFGLTATAIPDAKAIQQKI